MNLETVNTITLYIYSLIAAVTILAGIIGNMLVIVFFVFQVRRKTAYNTFILVLAVTDFVGCLAFYCQWLDRIAAVSVLGFIACKVLPIRVICVCISSALLVGMAFERYRGITRPLSAKKIQKKHIYLYFLAVSVFWFLYCTPSFVEGKFRNGGCPYRYDFVSRDQMNSMLIGREVLKFLIAVILMCYFYFGIKKALQRQRQHFQNSTLFKRNDSVLRTLKMLIIVFTICVGIASVQSVTYFATSLASGPKFESWTYAYTNIVYCFFYLNSAVNCFVYAGYMKEFRGFLIGLVRKNTAAADKRPASERLEQTSSELSIVSYI